MKVSCFWGGGAKTGSNFNILSQSVFSYLNIFSYINYQRRIWFYTYFYFSLDGQQEMDLREEHTYWSYLLEKTWKPLQWWFNLKWWRKHNVVLTIAFSVWSWNKKNISLFLRRKKNKLRKCKRLDGKITNGSKCTMKLLIRLYWRRYWREKKVNEQTVEWMKLAHDLKTWKIIHIATRKYCVNKIALVTPGAVPIFRKFWCLFTS